MRVRLWAGGAEGRWMVCLCLWVPRWLERGRSASAPSRIGKALWFWFHCSHQRPSSLPHAGLHVDPANTGNPPASTMADDAAARLETELLLLDAMYPHQTHYHPKSRELSFSQDDRASLLLRLPESYPASGSPDIISATDAAKHDLRTRIRYAVTGLGLAQGEEALDAILAAFRHMLDSAPAESHSGSTAGADQSLDTSKTVIVWLHHLLNTNKRKLALSPPSSVPPVSGLTKPGYPGLLVYSGPSVAVTEHVNTLKAQNWQAFQVRYEEAEIWHFAHGAGVREMETMSHVVKGVETEGAIGATQKEELLKAIGIK